MLKQGGTAVDAAIAANAALGLMEPDGTASAAICSRSSGTRSDGSSTASTGAAVRRSRWLASGSRATAARRSAARARSGQRAGRRRRLVRAARALRQAPDEGRARAGDRVRARRFPGHRGDRGRLGRRRRALAKIRASRACICPNGRAPAKGETSSNAALARHLHLIANGGRDAFYKGDRAHVRDTMAANGGFLTHEDLAAHTANGSSRSRRTIAATKCGSCRRTARASRRCRCSTSSKATISRRLGFGSTEHVHLFVEAKKLAYEDRAKFYADPAVREGAGRTG